MSKHPQDVDGRICSTCGKPMCQHDHEPDPYYAVIKDNRGIHHSRCLSGPPRVIAPLSIPDDALKMMRLLQYVRDDVRRITAILYEDLRA